MPVYSVTRQKCASRRAREVCDTRWSLSSPLRVPEVKRERGAVLPPPGSLGGRRRGAEFVCPFFFSLPVLNKTERSVTSCIQVILGFVRFSPHTQPDRFLAAMGGCISSFCYREAEAQAATQELGLSELGKVDLLTQGSLRKAYKLFRDADSDGNGKVRDGRVK